MSTSTEPTGSPAAPAKDASPAEIEADMAATRERLTESVDALADKVNVKARAQEKVDDTKQQAEELVDQAKARGADLLDQATSAPRPLQLAVVAVPVLVLVVVIITRLRRRS